MDYFKKIAGETPALLLLGMARISAI